MNTLYGWSLERQVDKLDINESIFGHINFHKLLLAKRKNNFLFPIMKLPRASKLECAWFYHHSLKRRRRCEATWKFIPFEEHNPGQPWNKPREVKVHAFTLRCMAGVDKYLSLPAWTRIWTTKIDPHPQKIEKLFVIIVVRLTCSLFELLMLFQVFEHRPWVTMLNASKLKKWNQKTSAKNLFC